MKKVIAVFIVLIFITGCGESKAEETQTLSCTIGEGATNIYSQEMTIDSVFDNEKITKYILTTKFIPLSSEMEASVRAMNEANLEYLTNEYEGTSVKVSTKVEDGAYKTTLTYTNDENDDSYIFEDNILKLSIDLMKEEYESQGYSCQIIK